MKNFQNDKKTKAGGLPPLPISDKTLNLNNTSVSNQLATNLLAITDYPKTKVELRNDLGIMHPTARTQELRDAGHEIHTIRVVAHTLNGNRHKSVANYVLRGTNHV